jgi:DNA-binding beta-propeller fold protein YncE
MKRSALIGFAALALAMAAPSGYKLLKEIPIGGDGGWDYLTVDSAARRLYVSHATHVVVVDLETGKVVGNIPDTPGVHGIAIVRDLNRGFISNGRGNNVTIFDLKTLQAIGQVKTGANPDAIQYEPVSRRVFTFNGRSKDATAFDPKTGKVEATIPLGSKPEFSAADGKGKIYVNLEDTSEVAEIDATKLAISKKYSLAPCEAPSGLAMDVKGRRIFSVCENNMMVVSDPDAGKVIATPAVGPGTDGAGFDPAQGLAFSSNGGDGTLTVVREIAGQWQVVDNVATQRGARTMTIDPKTHYIYLPVAQLGPAPAPTAAAPRPRPSILPNTFKVLVVGRPGTLRSRSAS